MKAYLVVFLCVLLCADQVHSLVCFTCEQQSRNWRCLKLKKCSPQDNYCMTTVTTTGLGLLTRQRKITKRCSPVCPTYHMNLGFVSYSSSCCQHFLCNLWSRWRT